MKRLHNLFFCFISLIFFSVLFFSSSYADGTDKFYAASVKVEGDKGENDLIAEAFTQVLIKVSGRSDVKAAPAYQSMLKSARSAISQFRYDTRTIATTETEAEDDSSELKEKWFWVRFNRKTIDNLLNQAQLPIWGKVRPETLIWFSQEIKGRRYLHSQHDEPEIYEIFKNKAEARGISLIFPFLDLEDQSSISTSDIWGNFNDSILLASRRYQAQATVTIRLFKERSGLWVSQWNLLMLGNVQSWELRDENKARIMATGIDELADKLAQQFTQKASDSSDSGVLIQINNVSDFKAFQELDDYLRNLATVKSAVLVQVKRDQAVYLMTYLGDKNSMIQEIQLGDFLNPVERTQVNYDDSASNSRDFKPVILDDLDKKNNSEISDREKALDNLDSDKTKDVNGTSSKPKADEEQQGVTTTVPNEAPPEKKIELVIPELEYWLAR